MARVVETDVCIIGAGIAAALFAEKLTEERNVTVAVIEAGRSFTNFPDRYRLRERYVAYGENPWPNDSIRDQGGRGLASRTMAVGGLALHWNGVALRFTPEDFRVR